MGISRYTRWPLLSLALGLAVVSMGAQGRGGLASATGVVQQTRDAIAHGDLGLARQLAFGTAGSDADRGLAQALIDLFAGKDADARAKLTPLAAANPMGDAAVELGLLDIRTGQAAEGRRRLTPIADVRTFRTADDYLRLARAARGIREFLLANDAYQRVADLPRPDVQTEWGDLFLARHQPGDAVANYRQALEYDGNWLPALIGLARALGQEDPETASAALDHVRSQAPDYPDLHLVTAEQALDDEDVEAAGEALDELARVKPGTVEELALRAAIAYKDGGLAAVEPAAARVAAINPRSALGYRRAGEEAAREYRFDDAAVLAGKAVAIDPEDAQAQFDLGLYQLRTGAEADARTALEASWDLDQSAPLTKNLLDLLDSIDQFEIVPHNDFIFKFAPEEADVLKVYALPLADEAYRQFVERYGIRPHGPILVEVFPRHDDFAVRTLGLPGLVGALGACFGRVVTMDSPNARPPGDFSWQATLWHELAHVFTLQLSDYRVPRWLTEGTSVYEEHRREPAWGRELTLEYARSVGDGTNFGLKDLPEAFKHPSSLALAYFEASLVVEHLVDENGEAGLRTLLQAYAGGADDAEAFSRAFGQSVDDADTSFRAFVAERYGPLSQALKSPEPEDVEPDDLSGLRDRAEKNPGNFISQFSYGQALLRAQQFDEARERLERAAMLAPQASGAGSPRALLAQLAESQDDPARARREWRQLLQYDHTNIQGARRLAALAAEAGDVEEENYALRLVADLAPFDGDVHARLGRRLLADGNAADALIEFEAALAVGPTNPAEARTDQAEALLALGRRDEARTVVMQALRDAPTYARAQDVLLKTTGSGQ